MSFTGYRGERSDIIEFQAAQPTKTESHLFYFFFLAA